MAKNEKGENKEQILDAPMEFVKEGSQFLSKCKKPDLKEYTKIVKAVGIGFVAVGVIGYAIKLIHIPIRYVIVWGCEEMNVTGTSTYTTCILALILWPGSYEWAIMYFIYSIISERKANTKY